MATKSPNHQKTTTPPEPVIGVVCALQIEIAPFIDLMKKVKRQTGNDLNFYCGRLNGVQVCVAVGGVGQTKARSATHGIIDAFQPPYILSAGFSGGLTSELQKHDIVVASSVHEQHTGKSLQLESGMATDVNRRLHVGGLITTNHIVRTIEEKQGLASASGSIAVDMESFAVARVCRERHTPFMGIRVVSDDLSSDLPKEVLSILGSNGSVRAGAVFKSLIKRPSAIKDLWDLRENAIQSSECLAKFLSGVVPQLADAAKKSMKEPAQVVQ